MGRADRFLTGLAEFGVCLTAWLLAVRALDGVFDTERLTTVRTVALVA